MSEQTREPTCSQRAAYGGVAMAAIRGRNRHERLVQMLCDLRHWASCHAVSFGAAEAESKSHPGCTWSLERGQGDMAAEIAALRQSQAELLEACEAMVAEIEANYDWQTVDMDNGDTGRTALVNESPAEKLLRAAIAKARPDQG